MTKRFFTLLLCFALLMTMMPASARALESGDYGTIHWTFERNTGRLEVSRNDDDEGPMRDFESAEDVPWYSFRESVRFVALNSQFTSISTYAFSGMTNLPSFSVPATVTWFGANAFEGCTSLESINIPNGVIALSTKCFKDCTSLTSVKLPDSVKTVGAYAFYGCTGLTSLNMGAGVTTILGGAFMNCTGLTSLTIPDSVTNISADAFKNCSGLTSVTMPGALTLYNAFEGCTKVKTVKLTIGQEAKVTSSNHSVWKKTGVNVSVTIDEGITLIDSMAFQYATKLKSVTIPASVRRIWNYAFDGCTGLTDVTYVGTEAQKAQMTIDAGNDPLNNAAWHYQSATATKPTVTTNPKSVTVLAGKKATFTVVAEDAESYKWQYKKPGDTRWTSVSSNGASSSYTLTAAERHNGYTYRCKVTNKAGSVYSKTATLTVRVKPKITRQPESVTVYVGKTATFGVVANDVDSYKWQYQKPGSNAWIDVSKNGTSNIYSLTTAAKHNGYTYRCALKNAAGTTYTDTVKLTVSEKPVITTQPASKSVTAGKKATFKVVADGAASYKWQYQKPGSSTWTNVSKNGTSATYSLTTAAKHNGYKYRCQVKNDKGKVYTTTVTLTVK